MICLHIGVACAAVDAAFNGAFACGPHRATRTPHAPRARPTPRRRACRAAKVLARDLVEQRTWRLLTNLVVHMPCLEAPNDTDWTRVADTLTAGVPDAHPAAAYSLQDRLVALANDYAPAAAEVDLKSLRREVHDLLDTSSRTSGYRSKRSSATVCPYCCPNSVHRNACSSSTVPTRWPKTVRTCSGTWSAPRGRPTSRSSPSPPRTPKRIVLDILGQHFDTIVAEFKVPLSPTPAADQARPPRSREPTAWAGGRGGRRLTPPRPSGRPRRAPPSRRPPAAGR